MSAQAGGNDMTVIEENAKTDAMIILYFFFLMVSCRIKKVLRLDHQHLYHKIRDMGMLMYNAVIPSTQHCHNEYVTCVLDQLTVMTFAQIIYSTF